MCLFCRSLSPFYRDIGNTNFPSGFDLHEGVSNATNKDRNKGLSNRLSDGYRFEFSSDGDLWVVVDGVSFGYSLTVKGVGWQV